MGKQGLDISEIRDLARKFTPEEIETCISQELEEGKNLCTEPGPADRVVDALAKAEWVRRLVDRGVPLAEAVRELAKRIRLIQKGFEPE
jgi:hypothetical protein